RDHGVDPPDQPIPVVPSAHYSCGGVVTDREGKTALPGLYVTGECAFTGIHGGNRLASNSLLEALVFSHRAAVSALKSERTPPTTPHPLPDLVGNLKGSPDFEAVRVEHSRGELQRLMWDYLGIVRRTDRLLLAQDRLAILSQDLEGYWEQGNISPAIIELRNM